MFKSHFVKFVCQIVFEMTPGGAKDAAHEFMFVLFHVFHVICVAKVCQVPFNQAAGRCQLGT